MICVSFRWLFRPCKFPHGSTKGLRQESQAMPTTQTEHKAETKAPELSFPFQSFQDSTRKWPVGAAQGYRHKDGLRTLTTGPRIPSSLVSDSSARKKCTHKEVMGKCRVYSCVLTLWMPGGQVQDPVA